MTRDPAADLEAPLPVDDAPALMADLSVIPAAGILSAIYDAKRSGLVLFRQRRHEKRIYLDAGEVVFASSNQAVDRLGECLLRSGAITVDELRQVEQSFQPGDRFGRVLVELGLLTPRELWNGVRNQVEEIVRSLFAMPGGRLWFWEGEIRPDNVVRLSLETSRLIAEGQQRSAELRRFLTVLEDPRVRLAQTGGQAQSTLAESERAIYEAVLAGCSFLELVTRLRIDRESAARSVQLLRLVGAVKLMRLPERPPAPEDASATGSAALAPRCEAFAKLIAAMSSEIARADGDDSIRTRLSRELQDVASRFPALLSGMELLPGAGALDPVRLLERATRLAGDPEDVLVTALSELVTYLEFELMNHAKIEDAKGFLRGLDPIRRAAFD